MSEKRNHWRIFYFSRANHLHLSRIVDDCDPTITLGWWLNGRIFGHYMSSPLLPWRRPTGWGEN